MMKRKLLSGFATDHKPFLTLLLTKIISEVRFTTCDMFTGVTRHTLGRNGTV